MTYEKVLVIQDLLNKLASKNLVQGNTTQILIQLESKQFLVVQLKTFWIKIIYASSTQHTFWKFEYDYNSFLMHFNLLTIINGMLIE